MLHLPCEPSLAAALAVRICLQLTLEGPEKATTARPQAMSCRPLERLKLSGYTIVENFPGGALLRLSAFLGDVRAVPAPMLQRQPP
ncbi:hypothetical protein P7K49_028456 [Saguinus oedipus]|uniref:Uncharacterized protein n=1 Tax=Saguinus oedipus TaxID=9490 RepID=A0ABQ9UDP2_SAGOE|nr:hypothetical protein P7K49_028456 [Saguinus oedipus]